MAAGERQGSAGFAFRLLPQKAFPCLQNRDIQDRLLKWWAWGSPLPLRGRLRGKEGAELSI